MRDVSEELKEKCKQLFGSDIFFEWNPVMERFVCKEVLNPMEPDYTKTVFVVANPDGSFRDINDHDLHRICDARVGAPSDKEARMKKITELLEKERLDRLAADKKKREAKSEFVKDLAKDLDRNPVLAKAFKAEAKARYSGEVKETATGGKVVLKKNKASGKKAGKK